jgi:hypothetical protein
MFVLWGLSYVYIGACNGSRATSRSAAGRRFRQVHRRACRQILKKCSQLADKKLAWVPACDQAWHATRSAQKLPDDTRQDGLYNKMFRHFWTDAQATLLRPFLWTLLATCLLIVAAGLGSDRGVWFGVLIDPRTKPFQPVADATDVLDHRAARRTVRHLRPQRDPGAGRRSTRRWNSSRHVRRTVGGARRPIWSPAPYLSALIRDAKDPPPVEQAADPLDDQEPGDAGDAGQKRDAETGELARLVTGEAAGTEKDVDVSRLQHLIISGLLIAVYLLQLGKLMRSVSAEMIATAYVSNRMPFHGPALCRRDLPRPAAAQPWWLSRLQGPPDQ